MSYCIHRYRVKMITLFAGSAISVGSLSISSDQLRGVRQLVQSARTIDDRSVRRSLALALAVVQGAVTIRSGWSSSISIAVWMAMALPTAVASSGRLPPA